MSSFVKYIMIILFCWSCPLIAQKEVKKRNKAWKKSLNKPVLLKSISDFYLETSMLNYPQDSIYKTSKRGEASKALKKEWSKIKKIKSAKTLKGQGGNALDIGYLITKAKKSYAYITAWRKTEDAMKIEVQLIKEIEKSSSTILEHPNNLRRVWEEYSNAHQPTKLLKITCHQDVVYFNNGITYNGIDEMIPKYKYMAAPNWKIKLMPGHLMALSDSLIFEIGTYISSGEGQYVLIWSKKSDAWKIEFDFNF